jgi:hypothetical protein
VLARLLRAEGALLFYVLTSYSPGLRPYCEVLHAGLTVTLPVQVMAKSSYQCDSGRSAVQRPNYLCGLLHHVPLKLLDHIGCHQRAFLIVGVAFGGKYLKASPDLFLRGEHQMGSELAILIVGFGSSRADVGEHCLFPKSSTASSKEDRKSATRRDAAGLPVNTQGASLDVSRHARWI